MSEETLDAMELAHRALREARKDRLGCQVNLYLAVERAYAALRLAVEDDTEVETYREMKRIANELVALAKCSHGIPSNIAIESHSDGIYHFLAKHGRKPWFA